MSNTRAENNRLYRQRQKEKGLCVRCAQPIAEGYASLCQRHILLARQAQRGKRVRPRTDAAGLLRMAPRFAHLADRLTDQPQTARDLSQNKSPAAVSATSTAMQWLERHGLARLVFVQGRNAWTRPAVEHHA
jgi:hypothetical protein